MRVRNLYKTFDEVQAVRDVSLDVRPGEIFSLLGPNGAGKSTTISMLACLLEPTAGDAYVMGHSILHEQMAVKSSIGVVPQEIALYEDLSARENLSFWGKMYGLRGERLRQRIDEVLEIIGLAQRQKGPVANFSGGMKRRLNIGVALLHRPDVLILDEPTVGIDPQSRRNILDSVQEFNRQGMTVLYTTHYMEEAQEISDHIAIMDQGEIIAYGTHDELVQIVGELDRIDLTLSTPPGQEEIRAALIQTWRQLDRVHQVSTAGHETITTEAGSPAEQSPDFEAAVDHSGLTLLVGDSNLVLPDLFETAVAVGARITSVDIQEPNLEAVFLHLTGRALRD
ncbi:MAG: ABC transporter ATP-binding protein [Anaerolineae bacterium]|nr:ABC transporter ATP-binding protein [Anaerolineae bacterium]